MNISLFFSNLKHISFFVIVAFIFISPTFAEETLYLSFDGNVNGIYKNNTVKPTAQIGNISFAAGKNGQAFAAGPTHGSLKFSTTNIINSTQGTVAMWVKPVDWSSTEPAFHVFFQTLGSSGLVLYKYFQNKSLLMLASQNMSTGPYFSSGLTPSWRPGEWHHIAGTWSNDGLLLYVDGVPAAAAPAFAILPQTLDKEFSLGDTAWTTLRTSYSLIDEVHIFNTALPPNEIKNLFQGKAVTNSPTPPTNLTINNNTNVAQTETGTALPTALTDRLTNSAIISSAITTPIHINGDTVSIADHQAQFAQNALPTQLKIGSNNLLSSPISLILNQNNQRIVLTPSNISLNQINNSDIAVAQGHLSGGSAALQISSTVERDGLITVELSTSSAGSIPTDAELSVEIPLNASAFSYRIRWQDGMRDLVEAIRPSTNIDITSFVPYYWLGNNDTGLFWFSDLSHYWPAALATDAIRIDRTGSVLLFRQKIKSIGQTLPANWKYRFGLQMTPVKTLASRQIYRLTPATNANMEVIWPTPTADSLKYYGYPEAANAKAFTNRVATIKNNKRLAISYLTPSFISTATSEWSTYKNLWMSGTFDSTSSDVRAMGGSVAGVTPTSSSWQSFITDKITKFQLSYQLDGFYFDNSQAYGIYNPQINLGYVVAGAAQKEYPIFEYRELFKRVIESIKQNNSSSKVLVHMSGHFAIPMLSLADAYIDGEQFRGIVKDNYLDVLSLDQLRAEFMGRQWGLVPIFLPEFDATTAAQVAPTRGLMALMMLHDINVWPQWCNITEVNHALASLDRYNYQQSEFIPYFSQTPPATSSSTNLLVSSYRNSTKDQLLVIGNIAKQSATGNICLNNSATQYKFTDWQSGKTIQGDAGGCINVSIGSQDYLLIRAEIQ